MKKLKVAVVGVGHLGKEHARIYHNLPQVELVGVVDTDAERAGQIAGQYNTQGYTNVKDIAGKIDAASIVVPTDKHYSVAKTLLKAGVHLLVEKPITSTLGQARRLVALADDHRAILQVGHIERFNPIVQELVQLVDNPKFIEIHRLSPFSARGTEVGVVFDLMIHDIDIILGLVSDEVKRIEAVGVEVLTPSEDIANTRITFRNGCVANLTASRVSQERMRKIRVFQPDSYLSLDYYKQEGVCFRKQGKDILRRELRAGKEEPLRQELSSFIQTVLSGARPLVSGDDAVRALAVADKIVRKIWT